MQLSCFIQITTSTGGPKVPILQLSTKSDLGQQIVRRIYVYCQHKRSGLLSEQQQVAQQIKDNCVEPTCISAGPEIDYQSVTYMNQQHMEWRYFVRIRENIQEII